MKPTVMGGAKRPVVIERETATPDFLMNPPPMPEMSLTQSASVPVPVTDANLPVVIPKTFPITLTGEQVAMVGEMISKMPSIFDLELTQIPELTRGPEENLHRTLDQFLSVIGLLENAKINNLMVAMIKAVDDEKLGELADRIIEGQPSFLDKLKSKMTPGGAQKVAQEFLEQTTRILQGKTRSLLDKVNEIDENFENESRKVAEAIQTVIKLREAFKGHFAEFIPACACMAAYLQISKAKVEEYARTVDPNDVAKNGDLMELQTKLQSLESKEIALETKLLKIPADTSDVQKIQEAAAQTLQETGISAKDRSASIKTTLIKLNTTLAVRGLQQVSEQQAKLDERLATVQSKLLQTVTTKAANAAGDNRVAQAKALRQIIDDNTQLKKIHADAKVANTAKFAEARKTLTDCCRLLTAQ